MKRLFFILFSVICPVFILVSCKTMKDKMEPHTVYSNMSLSELNDRIDKSQKEALDKSPFTRSNRHVSTRIKIQKPYRKHYLKELKGILSKNLMDTIFLVEGYSEECINCFASRVFITRDTLDITYQHISNINAYRRSEHKREINRSIPIEYKDDPILEIKEAIANNGSKWNTDPKRFGHENILGGGYTLYTVFLPYGKVESMYIRYRNPSRWTKH